MQFLGVDEIGSLVFCRPRDGPYWVFCASSAVTYLIYQFNVCNIYIFRSQLSDPKLWGVRQREWQIFEVWFLILSFMFLVNFKAW